MIYILDDFFDKNFLEVIQEYLSQPFTKTRSGDKDFYVIPSEDSFDEYVLERLSKIERKPLKNILSFFRQATDELDVDWRIHCDLSIKGERPDRAIVIYLSTREREDLHGTALWEHAIYGRELPSEVTDDDFDEILQKDSEDLDFWRLSTVIGFEENRLISYPSSYFHSKYPNIAWKNGRKVFVMFYKFA
jgi:hypothetical protein